MFKSWTCERTQSTRTIQLNLKLSSGSLKSWRSSTTARKLNSFSSWLEAAKCQSRALKDLEAAVVHRNSKLSSSSPQIIIGFLRPTLGKVFLLTYFFLFFSFKQLELPEYQSKEKLKERLLTAIKEGKTFGLAWSLLCILHWVFKLFG